MNRLLAHLRLLLVGLIELAAVLAVAVFVMVVALWAWDHLPAALNRTSGC